MVLATGIDGSGAWDVPRFLRDALPADRYAHTHAAIDFAALAGKRIAVLGAGASAFDNAATALERGAREVCLCFRRPSLVNVNAYRWAEFVGFLKHFGELPDADKWRFIQGLRQRHFDTAYVLKRSLSSALIAWFSGAHRRIGFATEARGLLLTRSVPYRHDQHEVQNFLDVLRADGVPVTDDHHEAWLSAGERLFASTFLHQHGVGPADRLIAIHPFATNKPRAWHEDNFIALANRLQATHNARVIVFGGPGDAADAQPFAERIVPTPIVAVGNTTLRQTMAP